MSRKNILITGISTGLGYAMASCLLEDGHTVIGSIRSHNADIDALSSLYPGRLHLLTFDVRDNEGIKSNIEACLADLGSLDVLINNAGIVVPGPLETMKIEGFKKQMDVNVTSIFSVTNACIPFLKKSSQSKIINMSSVSGIISNPFLGAYCISKHAVESLSDIYRRELLPWDIDVVMLQPGPIKSAIWKKSIDQMADVSAGPYAPYWKSATSLVHKTEKKALDPTVITNLVKKIISQKKSKTRYIVHRNPLMIRLVAYWLPDRWFDAMIKKQYRKILEK